VTDGFKIVLLPDELIAEERPGSAPPSRVFVEPSGVELPVSSPASTLVSITVRDVRENRDLVLAWLRSLVLAQPMLEAAYRANPRHVLLARMGHLAQDVGNLRLHDQIGRVLAVQHVPPRPDKVTPPRN
jgi:hypothetical protein